MNDDLNDLAAAAAGALGAGHDRMPHVEYAFSCPDGPDAEWRVRRMYFVEALSEPYQLVLDLLTIDTDADTDMLVGRSCEFTMEREPLLRSVHGVVERVEYMGVFNRGGANERLGVRIHVVPAFALMANRRNSRIFQGLTAVAVLDDVLHGKKAPGDKEGLDAYDRTANLEALTMADYEPPRDYCAQYRESDLAFCTRLMEEEGIAYFFDFASADTEVLKLVDTNDHYPEIETIDGNIEVPISAANPDEQPIESIIRFDWSRTVKTNATLVRHFDWKTPMDPIDHAGMSIAPGEIAEQQHEDYFHLDRRIREVYAGNNLTEPNKLSEVHNDSERRISLEVDRLAQRDEIGRGESNVTGMGAGRIFELAHDIAPRSLLLTRVIHTGESPEEELGAGGDEPNYRNTFECTSLAAPWRPPIITPKPRVYGPQTAIVTGPDNEEIHVDEHGRIKVVMSWDRHWDRERAKRHAPGSSCWVRVGQAWAGAGWGTMFIPRIGMEVIVEFLEGNPDRPMVTGCVYNGANQPPYTLPADKTKSTIKSNSSLGGGGFNEFRFEDLSGSEEVFLHAQKDFNEVVLNNHSTKVTANQSHSVGGNRQRTVDGDENINVKGNQIVTIDGGNAGGGPFTGNSITVTGDYILDVTKTILIKAPISITLECGGSTMVMTPNDITVTAGGKSMMKLDANILAKSSGNSIVQLDAKVLAKSVSGGQVLLTADANVSSANGGTLALTANADLAGAGGGALKLDGNVKMEGGEVVVGSTAGGKLELTANAELSGTQCKTDGGGSTVELQSGTATVTSSLINLNS
jgi:type VI secretion system secreted protein VgrG